MAGAPNIAQGTINRLRASVIWDNFPQLNVTASFLMPEGIDLTFEGQSTAVLPTMTGVVTSPEPYQIVRLAIHLIKSQGLADLYKQQQENTTLLGGCTIRPDTITLSPYYLMNCSITGVNALAFSGRDPGYVVTATGSYNLNAAAWQS